ncbi:MAG: tetratricopeptide repeat protein [Magnetococcales bacterium]|nr:tetratricopeptide repeat protein [Magnetococcales bacterium]
MSEEDFVEREMSVESALSMGISYHQKGNLQKAEWLYRKILEKVPDNPDALHFLGVIAYQVKQPDVAIPLIKKAIKIRPNHAESHSNLGAALRDAGQLDASIASCRKALELRANFPEAQNNLGAALLRQDKLNRASAAFRTAIAQNPEYHAPHKNLANILHRQGRSTEAALSLEKAINLSPNDHESYCNMATILSELGQFQAAVDHAQKALNLAPTNVSAHNTMGLILKKVGILDDAEIAFRNAISIADGAGISHSNLGEILLSQGHQKEALASHKRALDIKLRVNNVKNYLRALHYQEGLSNEKLYRKCRKWTNKLVKSETITPMPPPLMKDSPERLRIGYLSSDLHNHPVAFNMLPVMENHNHDQFEIFIYYDSPISDTPDSSMHGTLTDSFQQYADHWRTVGAINDQQIAEKIRADRIHIMVYLASTFDNNRLLVPAYRPAPIQVSYHNCSSSTINQMDYWLTDSVIHPPLDTEELFSEDLVRMPQFYIYPPPINLPDPGPLPSKKNGYITFVSLNNPSKITGQVVETWGRILKAVPDARLLLKYRNFYKSKAVLKRLKERLEGMEIDPERLEYRTAMDDHPDHLANYLDADIALDPFPFTGATTTFQALWMGVPVVTLMGKRFISRMATDIIVHAGLEEPLGADNLDEYVRKAVALAENPTRLAELRSSLRERIAQSPLVDGPRYTRNLEKTYLELWDKRR